MRGELNHRMREGPAKGRDSLVVLCLQRTMRMCRSTRAFEDQPGCPLKR
jgi:hypothetical protein